MDWASEALYNKSKLYAQRAHDEPVDAALFGFWMSLSLELLARAALAKIHPALLADPREPDNIHYAFGINPKNVPRSIQAKAVFARCSVFVKDYTDSMSAHCLILADRRNSELHSGMAAFEGVDNSSWLPATYEVIEVLLKHLQHDFEDLLTENHSGFARNLLADRRSNIKKDVQSRISKSKSFYANAPEDWKAEKKEKFDLIVDNLLRSNNLRRRCACPACSMNAVIAGESIGRSLARIDAINLSITREVRVLPNFLSCPFCKLSLKGYQELKEANLGAIYTVQETEDPVEFFGIVPEDYVDTKAIAENYYRDEYDNE